jgi:hypothetical protein
MTYNEKIIDITTGEETLREYTKEEIAAVEAEKIKVAEWRAIVDAENKAKETARKTVLDKLGLTAEESAALLA